MSPPGGNAGLLSDRQVDLIATRLAERLSAPPAAQLNVRPAKFAAPRSAPAIAPRVALGEGVFTTVDDAVEAAGIAFHELDGMSLDRRRKIIASIRSSMLEHAEELARHAQRETGMGGLSTRQSRTAWSRAKLPARRCYRRMPSPGITV